MVCGGGAPRAWDRARNVGRRKSGSSTVWKKFSTAWITFSMLMLESWNAGISILSILSKSSAVSSATICAICGKNPELPRHGNAMERWTCRWFSTVAARRGVCVADFRGLKSTATLNRRYATSIRSDEKPNPPLHFALGWDTAQCSPPLRQEFRKSVAWGAERFWRPWRAWREQRIGDRKQVHAAR
jgi:hypothetical protein